MEKSLTIDGNVVSEDELTEAVTSTLLLSGCLKTQAQELAAPIVKNFFARWGNEEEGE